MSVNMLGFIYSTQLTVKQMLKQGQGSVVSISASLADQPIAGVNGSVSMMTKGGLNTVIRSLAIEYARQGIRFNAVAPGVVETPLHKYDPKDHLMTLQPMGKIAAVKDIVDAVLYLAEAGQVTGEILHVDGGAHAGPLVTVTSKQVSMRLIGRLTMNEIQSTEISRRRLLAIAGVSAGAALLGRSPVFAEDASKPMLANANADSKHTSFAPLKQIDAGVLNIGYAEDGPADGKPVILLHGWPYDIYSFVDVAPLLASAGYRVIVPFLRGYGTTRFLAADAFRNGQPAAVSLDVIALMDALKIKQAVIRGLRLGKREQPAASPRFGRNAARASSP